MAVAAIEAATPLRKDWTATSRLYALPQHEDGRERRRLIAGIAWQNYVDDERMWQEIDLTPSGGKRPRADLTVDRAPYRFDVGLDGFRRIFPDRHDLTRSLEFPPVALFSGRTFLAGQNKIMAGGAKYDVEIGWDNSRVTFDTILKEGVTFDSVSFDVVQNGISDAELLALLGQPKVYEQFGEKSSALDVSLKAGQVTLGFDATGMAFPLVVDPTLDLDILAAADDIRHRGAPTHDIVSSNMTMGYESTRFTEPAYRYTGVSVSGTVDVAKITFLTRSTNSGDVDLEIYAHAADNSPQIVTDANWHTIADANLTAASAPWAITNNWVIVDEANDTPSLVAVFQELVDGGYLASEVAHVIILNTGATPSRIRRPYAYEQDSSKTAALHIEYTVAAGAPPEGGGSSHKRRIRKQQPIFLFEKRR